MFPRYVDRYSGPICRIASRQYATQPAPKVEKSAQEIKFEDARPFEEIPGPSGFQFIRSMLPGGEFYKRPTYETIKVLNGRYGPLFRMPGFFGNQDVYVAMNPDDYSTIFRHEGQWPYRRSFQSLVYHREVHRADFFQGVEGIISTQGEKWAKVRTAVNPILMQPANAKLYINNLHQVSDEFLARIRDIRDPVSDEMPANFEEEMNRLTFDSVCAVALNTHLGLLRKNRDTEESKTILKCIRRFLQLAYVLDITPSIWRYVKTPAFREMMSILDTLTNICNKYITEALVRTQKAADGTETSVLEKMANIDKKVAVVMALDMMMAGVDTTSSTLTGILLCLAKSPEKQQKLFEEIKGILPEKDSRLTMDNMRNLPYLRASIKEGIRIYPIIPGTMRRMPVDVVLSGYKVVAGTDVSMGANLQLMDEEFVPMAKTFMPERWIREDKSVESMAGHISNAFMYLPFGFGVRSCAGKRIVNMEMEIVLASLVRNFTIEYNHPYDDPFTGHFIKVPGIPLKFKFSERPN